MSENRAHNQLSYWQFGKTISDKQEFAGESLISKDYETYESHTDMSK